MSEYFFPLKVDACSGNFRIEMVLTRTPYSHVPTFVSYYMNLQDMCITYVCRLHVKV